MAEYTKEVFLPSKGVFYPDHEELSGPIKIRMMTTEDEKVVFGSSGNKMTKRLIEGCLVEPKFDTDILIPQDLQYLFMQLRVFTYGADYHLKCKCDCEASFEAKINIDEDLVVYEIPDDFDTKLKIELPVSKTKLVCKYLTVADNDKIASRAKNFAKKTGKNSDEFEFVYRKAFRILTIDGEEKEFADREKFVRELVGRDSAYLDSKLNSVKIGYDYLVTVRCPECGQEFETVFEMNSEFFRPRFD